MRVIFLDFDGVLNSLKFILKMGEAFDNPIFQIDPEAVKLLNILYQATNASIVVTSTWRKPFIGHLDKLQDCMASYNILAPVIGMTDDLAFGDASRGQEIKKWLTENPAIKYNNFIIFDDNNIEELNKNLIQTSFDDGLQKSHILQAINYLGGIYCPCSCRSCYAGPFPCHCEVDILNSLK